MPSNLLALYEQVLAFLPSCSCLLWTGDAILWLHRQFHSWQCLKSHACGRGSMLWSPLEGEGTFIDKQLGFKLITCTYIQTLTHSWATSAKRCVRNRQNISNVSMGLVFNFAARGASVEPNLESGLRPSVAKSVGV